VTELLAARKSRNAKAFLRSGRDLEQRKRRLWLWVEKNLSTAPAGLFGSCDGGSDGDEPVEDSAGPALSTDWFMGPFYRGRAGAWQQRDAATAEKEARGGVLACDSLGLGRGGSRCPWPRAGAWPSALDAVLHAEHAHAVDPRPRIPWRA
jgi:hypothetical protein